MWWFVVILEQVEALLAQLGDLHAAGEVCRFALMFGMVGPCSQ